MNSLVKLAVSTGEPSGIGPEVSLAAAKEFVIKYPDTEITLFGDRQLFSNQSMPNQIQIQHSPLNEANQFGKLNSKNADYVLSIIRQASQSCQKGSHHALVTAPVQKSILNTPSHPFSGHTEYLAELDRQQQVVMMLCGEISQGISSSKKMTPLRVALATTHLPISQVANNIQFNSLGITIKILESDLRLRFGISKPKIAVTGLNPHAGEDGHLGREEMEVIAPAIKAAQELGMDVKGPFPADSLFQSHFIEKFDAILAMYHDQGLAPFKFATFTQGVNITLGLSYIRTSVDHGTALDIAGQGKADWHSMFAALTLARELAVKKMSPNASSS